VESKKCQKLGSYENCGLDTNHLVDVAVHFEYNSASLSWMTAPAETLIHRMKISCQVLSATTATTTSLAHLSKVVDGSCAWDDLLYVKTTWYSPDAPPTSMLSDCNTTAAATMGCGGYIVFGFGDSRNKSEDCFCIKKGHKCNAARSSQIEAMDHLAGLHSRPYGRKANFYYFSAPEIYKRKIVVSE
jgi:hypothetical protein